MKSVKNLLVILLALLISFSAKNFSFAETAPIKKKAVPPPVAAPTIKKQGTQTVTTKEQTVETKGGICDCLKGAIDAIQNAYVRLEEDEWPTAIKATKDTINTINTLSKTCACPETVAYGKIAEAYLKYAEGGNHLDGAEKPDCQYAIMLYSDARTLLENYIPKITNVSVKENAQDVQGYVKEEEEFVNEECSEDRSQKESKSAGESKSKEKK